MTPLLRFLRRDRTADVDLCADELLYVIDNRRRRRMIRALRDFGGQGPLGQLADAVAALEHPDETAESVSGQGRKSVYVGLYQTHAPVLNDAELVDYRHDDLVATPALSVAAEIIDHVEAELGGAA